MFPKQALYYITYQLDCKFFEDWRNILFSITFLGPRAKKWDDSSSYCFPVEGCYALVYICRSLPSVHLSLHPFITLPACLVSRVIWKPQAAGWWMKYFLIDPCKLCRAGLALHRYCCSQRPCHHRYTCWLLALKESIFAESKERCLCFQVCLWSSTVRWMNGTDISTKKK